MISIVRNKLSFLKYIIAVFVLLLVAFIGYSFLHGNYYLAHEDEVTYYNDAKIFYETGSVRASDCLTENVSKIWQCNWYGPMYHIFYGSIAKIVGLHTYNFLVTNLICFLISIVLILKADFTKEAKLLIICSFFALHSIVEYLFTFFPETLILLFGVILTLILYKLSVAGYKTKKFNRIFILYILLVMFFALFRITMVFWVFGLLAFSWSRKDFLKKLVICLVCFLLIYIYGIYFNAPYYAGSMAKITNNKIAIGTIVFLAKKLAWNSYVFVAMNNPFYDLLQIPVLIITFYSLYISKNMFMMAACIISFIYFVVLLTLYSSFSFYINKLTACLYPLVLIAFFTTDKARLKYLVLSFLLLFSPITYLNVKNIISDRKKMAIRRENVKPLIDQFQQIKYKIEGGKPRTILTLYRDFDKKVPFEILASSLPCSTTDKFPILYTNNFHNEDNTVCDYSSNFNTWGRIYVDYILSAYPLKIDSTSMVCSCDLFYLYKNNKTTK
ncbi:MAG: hypothetical protein ACLQQ4_10080 [Bacteroidia bacterium]